MYFTIYSFGLRIFFEIVAAALTMYSIYDIVDTDENEQRFEGRIKAARTQIIDKNGGDTKPDDSKIPSAGGFDVDGSKS